MLADRFVLQARNHILTTNEVAAMFNTPAAKLYLELGHNLLNIEYYTNDPARIAPFIKNGADVNFTFRGADKFTVVTPLYVAIEDSKDKIVKFLLNSGAHPWPHDLLKSELIATGNLKGKVAAQANAIQKMLEEVTKKAQK